MEALKPIHKMPLFEDLLEQKQQAQIIPPKIKFWTPPVVSKQSAPSSLQVWYQIESRLREKGLKNDLDIAQMKAAMQGVKNKWTASIQRYRELFKHMLSQEDRFDWEKAQKAFKFTSKKIANST